MKITYQLTPRDFQEASAPRKARKVASVIVLVLVLCLAVPAMVGTPSYRTELFWQNLFPFIAIFAFYFLILWLLPRRNAKKLFESMPSVQAPISLEATDSGVKFETQNGNSENAWPAFPKWSEQKSFFLLYSSQSIANVIPKRAFSEGEEEEFRRLLTGKIPKRI